MPFSHRGVDSLHADGGKQLVPWEANGPPYYIAGRFLEIDE